MGAPQRFRQRYIAFRAEGSSEEDLKENLFNLGQELDYPHPPKLVRFNPELHEGLILCCHLQVDRLKGELKDLEIADIEVLGVSGTIKKARQKFLTT